MQQILNGELADLRDEGYQLAKARNLPEIGQQLKAVYTSLLGKWVLTMLKRDRLSIIIVTVLTAGVIYF